MKEPYDWFMISQISKSLLQKFIKQSKGSHLALTQIYSFLCRKHNFRHNRLKHKK